VPGSPSRGLKPVAARAAPCCAIDYPREGQHSLADVTLLHGFSDQSNFTRAFRRRTGRTPRDYLS